MKKAYLLLALSIMACKKEPEMHATREDIKELVFASGQVEWENTYSLVAQTEGTLTELGLEVGQDLKTGEVVGRIDNPTANENLRSANEQVALAQKNVLPAQQQIEANIKFAEQKYSNDKLQAERYERLYAKQSVSKQEHENMQIAAQNSLSQLNALKEQLESVKVQNRQSISTAQNQKNTSQIAQAYSALKVTQAGKVIEKMKQLGDYVRKGDEIAKLANAQATELVLNVDESGIARVQVGQKVFIRLNTEKEKVYEAVITEILAAFNESTQSFTCKAEFTQEPPVALYGTQLEANILVGEKKNALLIPRGLMGYGNTVRVKGKDEPVVVKTGIVSTTHVEILEGISADDVLLPQKP